MAVRRDGVVLPAAESGAVADGSQTDCCHTDCCSQLPPITDPVLVIGGK
ncbi:hypothetical protein ACFO5R_22220 [Halosolutus amylolyticus]|uniref:Uncharacterized protein n=1 Tax=Halosolutus amylolyticus TaxID=2932267 RepID=A0ABD5PVY8_9EURY|nr:hypothetical protein [Halosolutus amylolyticus]